MREEGEGADARALAVSGEKERGRRGNGCARAGPRERRWLLGQHFAGGAGPAGLGWAGAEEKKWPARKWPAGRNEEGEKMNFSFFLNTFSNLIFKLNLNSIQILVKANHYKNNCAAT